MNQYRRFSTGCHATRASKLCGLTALFWLSALAARANEIERPADAIEVFHCAFDEAWDANYDDWPDRWTRKTGEDYPHYVDVRMAPTEDPRSTGGRFLQIKPDGSSAAISSPPIRVTSRFSYLLTTQLYVKNLKHSEVTLTIDFYNAEGKKLQSRQEKLRNKRDGWHTVNIESIDPGDQSIDRGIITLDVQRGSRGDLHGLVALDDVWLARLPRITVFANSPYNVYSSEDDVVVRCELSGIREQNPEIRFQLLDASSKELHGGSVYLDGRLIEEDTRRASDIIDGVGNTPKGYEGATEWRPNIQQHGFYSVVVTMLSSDATGKQTDEERRMDRRVIWLAIVPPLPMSTDGDFGWSLPNRDGPLSLQALTKLLPKVGIHWVKLPAWYDAAEPHRGDDIIRFVEMLGASNIEVIGVIDHPPAGSELGDRMGLNASIADLLALDQATWLPALDPVMSRLSMRLRFWQLGDDQDMSLVGDPKLPQKMSELRERLFRFGQQVKLGVPWVWDAAIMPPQDATWEFEQLMPDPKLSLKKFEAFVAQPRRGKIKRWLTIEPPPRHESSDEKIDELAALNARATQFVRKIVAAKEHGIDAILISRPFDDHVGLMRSNGMPAELLLPWRTSAAMLGGSKYIGSVQLPNGSENRNFLRPDGKVVMVVWSGSPEEETLFLGNDVQQIDIWGGTTPLKVRDHEQTVRVGPVPSFVIGVNEPILRWRMALAFKDDHVESIFAKPHPNAVHFRNYFPQGVGGTIAIVAERTDHNRPGAENEGSEGLLRDNERWTFDPPEGTISLSANESATFPFDVRLKNAIFGEQPVRVDFVVDADEKYYFSVYRKMWVGSGTISVDFQTHLEKDGSLVVEQIMKNTAPQPVDFKCFLYAKGYRRQRAQVYRLGATPDRTTYRFRNGATLVGKELTLEAEEIGGERVLKCRFMVADKPPEAPQKPDAKAEPPGRKTFQDALSEPQDRV
ncbi:MAG: hypothetical protein AB7G28_01035 [Pirellulales bacterium]